MEPAPIVCLLPVRNGGADLPGWLEAAPTWCDSVVALDDGSTDATADCSRGSELVRVLLQNPTRGSAAGWDDGRNRAALLDAAAILAPSWVVQVDVDERIPAPDAAALRAFLASGCAGPPASHTDDRGSAEWHEPGGEVPQPWGLLDDPIAGKVARP